MTEIIWYGKAITMVVLALMLWKEPSNKPIEPKNWRTMWAILIVTILFASL